MKKIILSFIFVVICVFNLQAGYMSARGLQNNSEVWYFIHTPQLKVYSESFYGFTQHTVYGTYSFVDYHNNELTNQPFEVTLNITLPSDAIINNAQLLVGESWIQAEPEEVLTAEANYNESAHSNPRFLLREFVTRNYYGNWTKRHELKLGPVYYNKRFAIVISFITTNVIDVQAMHNSIPLREFYVNNYRYSDNKSMNFEWNFRDYDNPDSKPVCINDNNVKFNKTTDGWWQTKTKYLYVPELKWNCNFFAKKDIRLFKDGADYYYHTLTSPPLTAADRKTRRILIINDLVPELCLDQNSLINNIKNIAQLCLAGSDSINLMNISGLAPATLFPGFVPATSANITTLFNTLTSQKDAKINGLPQLLRAAKDYFNKSGQGGEIWFLSTSYSHSNPPSIANEIMDLSFYQLKYPVIYRIIDGSEYRWYSYTYVNGIYYYGNDYLYQNLARLSGGGLLTQYNVEHSSTTNMLFELADLLASAIEMAKLEIEPANGFSFSKYPLYGDRTHFPITFPYYEIGRYEGNLPFSTRFFGLVDGNLFTKIEVITANDTTQKNNNKFIKTIWYAKHLEDLLNQPQSYATIEKIGQLSKQNHIVSPYCAFVIPASNGYKGFKRLVELDSLENTDSTEPETPIQVPAELTLHAFPNPFNANTTIQISLPATDNSRIAEIRIVDVLGRVVKIIKQNIENNQSEFKILWNGCNDSGITVSSGLYFVQCITGDYSQTIKITFLK